MTFKTIASYILAALLILIVLTCVKIIKTSKNEFLLAENYHAKSEHLQAITHYERALHWFLPFSQTPHLAAEKLWAIAEYYQTQNQIAEALKTYRILRSAFYSIRSITTPGENWIHRCNDKIAHLMALNFLNSQETPNADFAEKKSQYLVLLEANRPPFTFPSLMTELGFFGWVSSILLFLFKALSPQGNIQKSPSIVFGSTFLIFYSIWIWGLFNA